VLLVTKWPKKTAKEWQNYGSYANRHFSELMATLDKEEPTINANNHSGA
jgi:hypothetical protein